MSATVVRRTYLARVAYLERCGGLRHYIQTATRSERACFGGYTREIARRAGATIGADNEETGYLSLAMTDARTHAAFLAAYFASPFTGFLRPHARLLIGKLSQPA